MQVFEFTKSKEFGDYAEAAMCVFFGLSPAKFYPNGTRITTHDAVTQKGEMIEIKGEGYTFDKSKNFFFEKTSNEETGTLGGPWRAQRDNVHRIIYYWPKERHFWVWNPKQLVAALDEEIKHLPIKRMENKGRANKNYFTLGYAVPREKVEHKPLCLQKGVIPKEWFDKHSWNVDKHFKQLQEDG